VCPLRANCGVVVARRIKSGEIGDLNGERSAIHLRSANDILRSARRSVEGENAQMGRKALGERLEAVVEERGGVFKY